LSENLALLSTGRLNSFNKGSSVNWLLQIIHWWREVSAPASLGQRGERAAEKFLKSLGYKIVARGTRNRLGELDLVAVDGRTVVFVEVKTRTTHEAGHPAEAVDDRKQRRVTRAAQAFIQQHDLHECSFRFDVIAITWPEAVKAPIIEHIRQAFEAIG
jgi:putative endonuclease